MTEECVYNQDQRCETKLYMHCLCGFAERGAAAFPWMSALPRSCGREARPTHCSGYTRTHFSQFTTCLELLEL